MTSLFVLYQHGRARLDEAYGKAAPSLLERFHHTIKDGVVVPKCLSPSTISKEPKKVRKGPKAN
ncbi:hypothetical protein OUZ56_011351 [Daphnia magna]|uniref:Uncharacterized protein n=1 Tax=Daphnia magna TaxID=35525 RepID=A0ABQ9YZW0_9CRUS|nr:hypothetical protein OUZ56_011351 [Daphnia magna]